ncbi:hypothetical protein GE300_09515 [Rhodobacteraceae bacterium 2CG4]|uniref:Uncharacterized protein n=1 Tax=Halovulum marinum TaxID=2662447 RepID=A0A6L5Z1B3_9RHOB|nr:hypothetical protein [Halovulum marinum]MSU89850.1 hypothetical protein [Halovulum marinum]
MPMTEFKSTPAERLEKRCAQRLKKHGFKLAKRGGYAIYCYNEVVGGWVEADGLTPVPYSLCLEDVIRLTHEYAAEAEVAELEVS